MSELGTVSFRTFADAVKAAYLEGYEKATRDVSGGRGADRFSGWQGSEAQQWVESMR